MKARDDSRAPARAPDRSVGEGALFEMRYIPALDGLRALAVAFVFALHAAQVLPLNPGLGDQYGGVVGFGWVGVDLFFVLSGFLITGIVYDKRNAEHRVSAFFGRRLVRIVPLCYATLVAYWLVLGAVVPPGERAAFAAAVPWHAAFATNIRLAVTGSWDAAPAFTSHFWSLAVEEQFYLVWPPLIWLASRGQVAPRRLLMRACVWAVVVALATRGALWALGAPPMLAYVLLPARLDALAIGGWVALWVRGPGGLDRARAAGPVATLAAAGGALILVSTTQGYGSEFDPVQQTVGYTAWACIWAAVIVHVIAFERGALVRLLSGRALVGLGRISFGVYLIHFPVLFVLDRVGVGALGAVPFALAAVSVTAALAALAWFTVERPALQLKRHFPYAARPLARVNPLTATHR